MASPSPITEAQERRYHIAMGNLCADRGFLNLAQSHLVAARDCPKGCGCFGCEAARRDKEDERKRRAVSRAREVRP